MDFPWYSQYPKEVPHQIDADEYSSIMSLLEESFRKYQDKDSFSCMGKVFTYGEIDILSKKFASFLQNDLKLAKGDRVAIMMPNILQYPIALFGVLRAGLVAVNINPLYTARELEHILKDSQANTIIIFENSCHILQDVLANTDVQYVLTTAIGDFLNFPKNAIVNFVIKHIKKMVPSWHIPKARNFKQCVFSGEIGGYKAPEIRASETAFLQYTGGTTGVSKGAILSNRNITANLLQIRAWIKEHVRPGNETIITALPLYHIFSLTANCLLYSSIGARNILITNPRDIPGFVKELGKWKFSCITGVNTLFNALLNNEDFKNLDFSALRLCIGGGMAVQKSVATKWHKVTKVPIIEAYGLTETSPAACINPLNLTEYNGKIGVPIPSTKMQILDDKGNPLPTGEPGEIAIHGPQVMQGYWNRPEETNEAIDQNGFFKTGDIGIMDEQGMFQIVDRKKDMILVSGFNVFPNEVEAVLSTHDKVLESAVIGIPDKNSGEAVKAFVVKRDRSLTEDELHRYCKNSMAAYKVPRFYEFKENLPKSNVGKILRKELRVKKDAQQEAPV